MKTYVYTAQRRNGTRYQIEITASSEWQARDAASALAFAGGASLVERDWSDDY